MCTSWRAGICKTQRAASFSALLSRFFTTGETGCERGSGCWGSRMLGPQCCLLQSWSLPMRFWGRPHRRSMEDEGKQHLPIYFLQSMFLSFCSSRYEDLEDFWVFLPFPEQGWSLLLQNINSSGHPLLTIVVKLSAHWPKRAPNGPVTCTRMRHPGWKVTLPILLQTLRTCSWQ